MSADDNVRGETSDGPYEEEVRDDISEDPYESDEDTSTWVPWGWSWRGGADDPGATDDPGVADDPGVGDEGGSWWDEGLYSSLILIGAVLFFFPEPATSALGVVLILIGAVGWLVDAMT